MSGLGDVPAILPGNVEHPVPFSIILTMAVRLHGKAND